MPVDAGVMTPIFDLSRARDVDAARPTDSPETADSLGAAFRFRREARGQDLEQLSLATRIRPQYLAAIEAMRLDDLPSRPFVIGYVRAYASALGLDPEEAALRYKQEAPERDPVRTAPVGVERQGDPSFRMVIVLGVLVIAAIVIWNIAQHVMSRGVSAHGTRPAAVSARIVSASKPPAGPVSLGAPLPPPTESTTPEPYVTPGLAPSISGQPAAAPTTAAPPAVGTPFVAKGPVYGAPAATALVILQADKPTSVVVRGVDGSVYFARQLETGESYGAPTLQGLTVEVSNPDTISVFVGRALTGPLPAATAPLSSLTGAANPAAKP
ncbi:MAG TPA: helix-turn-helix domain-containing protein [Caulobacteraceae bacterium]|nr:helix-turn-helix domain-containing protein [Caulobacteraceae bacterium]